ncbi:Caspase family protein [Burkholderiales bacterium 8X]|nr:Caspase family protein [Burkholderiales bacterium 8X]
MKSLRILCVHGVGRHPTGGPWEGEWQKSIAEPLQSLDAEVQPEIEFVYMDDIFDQFKISALDVLEAIGKLGWSGATSIFRRPKALGDDIRWSAGMVVQWVENDKLRRLTRDRVTARIKQFDPHLIIAHSLGTLVCYDAFTTPAGQQLVAKRRLVTAGSQIGNPFVVGNFAMGRLSPLPNADFWYHLYNKEDDVFTAEIRLNAPNFVQIETFFDIDGVADHDVTEYMRHGRTVSTVWADAVMALRNQPLARRINIKDKPTKRALLVGINEYADSSQNLEGCVNDAFLMSAMLQESGFAAEDVRLLLNERATCANLVDRLGWLLEGAKAGDTRFFYYSGHGAQLPTYGPDERVDRVQETLVLHDFDWTAGRAFTDDQFHTMYSQLPYELQFVAMFDCCHSAGMTRSGGRRVRGIDPPDDVRHRLLRWDAAREMWVPRQFEQPNPAFDKKFNGANTRTRTASGTGATMVTHRLGQAMDLRRQERSTFKREAKRLGHMGPYLPVLIYASRDDQFSYEYQHGAIAHGAFTYSLVKALRNSRKASNSSNKQPMSFEALVKQVGLELKELQYEQEPTLVAPTSVKKMAVPLKA